jgi:hypothetical protein
MDSPSGMSKFPLTDQELHDLTSYMLGLRQTTSLFYPGFLLPAEPAGVVANPCT